MLNDLPCFVTVQPETLNLNPMFEPIIQYRVKQDEQLLNGEWVSFWGPWEDYDGNSLWFSEQGDIVLQLRMKPSQLEVMTS